ncbi:type VII toxin-antitoxin system MntA family adenylyltransferase antitoxin [Bacillus pinisoli]|uniref:type VII toxin-antitoxin system MntA family adenylyltransferase antitoxin n=1 Tax=Bacillus pinisoli TaxID=2901866 RepID=UPI001FF51080|nr:nucleotidyltransferase domain-containing protein [Bacillus pinisoli]
MQSTIIDFLKDRIAPDIIYIFGSTVKGRSNGSSDIDIAYQCKHPVDQYQNFLLAQELAVLIDMDVDLINLHKASTVFQAQIVSTGKAVYYLDNFTRMNYEMKTLKMYAKLNEERQEIIKSAQESGFIYHEE